LFSVARGSWRFRTSCVLRTFANAALLLFVGVGSAAAEISKRTLVEFHGNVLFDELVYRSVLQLPESGIATAEDAREASAKLSGFLHRAGYDLATVRGKLVGEQIALEIDEGRLDKIIVFGEGLVETFRFRLALSLPASVFNRPALERQLRVLGERYQLRHYSYELVPAEVQENYGPQIDELQSFLGLPGIQPGLRYTLHILITSTPWSRGFSPEVSIGSPEGLGGGGNYREQDFYVPDDRWEVRGRVAGGMRQHLDSASSRLVLTRAFVEGRWFSPPLFAGGSLRPAVTMRGDLLSLQRSDLRLESFDQATFSSSLDAGVFGPFWTFAAGVGIERRFLFALVKAIGANPLIDASPRAQTRPYGEVIAEMVFNRDELRTDRKHRLDLEARFYTGSPSSERAIWLRATWQRRFPIGWHDFVWAARGTMREGQVLFPDEESVGNHLNGAFGSDYARKLVSTGLEFRYSLLRDVCKVGLFYDQVLYGAIDRVGGGWSVGSAGAGGPSFHLLWADEFQIDVYFALGWKIDGATDFSPGLVLRQVF
jgi:hypothetical protein